MGHDFDAFSTAEDQSIFERFRTGKMEILEELN
jgi:hypothetical protein